MGAKPPVARSAILLEPVKDYLPGLLQIRQDKLLTQYRIYSIPNQLEGRAFQLNKLGTMEVYDLRVGQPADCSCDCPGFTYRDKCKHIFALLALIKAAKL